MEKIPGISTVTINQGPYEALVAPLNGGHLLSLEKISQKGTYKALHEPDSRDELLKTPTSYGLPVLFPPNRIDGGTFTAAGKTYHFPINEAERNNSLHGFLHTRPWKVISQSNSGLTMEFTLGQDDGFYDSFPVEGKVRLSYELDEEGLEQTIRVANTGEDPMPLGLGWHSAFSVEPTSRIRLSIGQRVEMTDRMLPSGVVRDLSEGEEAFRRQGQLPCQWEMDDHYTVKPLDMGGKPFHGALIDNGSYLIRYTVDPFYRHWMVWNAYQNGHFICLEPQNWRVNAPNLVEKLGEEAGFDLIPPGQTVTAKAHIEILEK